MVEIIFSQPGGIGRNSKFLQPFETFWRHGYDCWTADAARRPVSEQIVREMAESGKDSLRCTNFLFADKGRAPVFANG
jgi:hypothetical protein